MLSINRPNVKSAGQSCSSLTAIDIPQLQPKVSIAGLLLPLATISTFGRSAQRIHMLTTASRGPLVRAQSLALRRTSAETIRRQVHSLLSGMYPQQPSVERRSSLRFAYPQLLRVTSTLADGHTPGDRKMVVVGKTLSEGGLGFFHEQPLVDRRVIVSLSTPENEPVSFLLDITWCRFTTMGWYESGGRFLEVVETPR
jgi:hypothetical protein